MTKWRCGKFSSFLWNSDTFIGEVKIDFSSEIESCFNEIQYQETRRQDLKKQTNKLGPLILQKKLRLQGTFP